MAYYENTGHHFDGTDEFEFTSNIPGEDPLTFVPDNQMGVLAMAPTTPSAQMFDRTETEYAQEFAKRMVPSESNAPLVPDFPRGPVHVNYAAQQVQTWKNTDPYPTLDRKIWGFSPRTTFHVGQELHVPTIGQAQTQFNGTELDAKQHLRSDAQVPLRAIHDPTTIPLLPQQRPQTTTHRIYGIREMELPLVHGGAWIDAPSDRSTEISSLVELGSDPKYQETEDRQTQGDYYNNVLGVMNRGYGLMERPNDNYKMHERDAFSDILAGDLKVYDQTQQNQLPDSDYRIDDDGMWI